MRPSRIFDAARRASPPSEADRPRAFRRRVVALAALLFASCATTPPPPIEHVQGADYAGVIVSADLARTYYKSIPLWTPSRTMVADYERRLARRLPRERLPPPDLWANVKRRYFGMFEYGTGRKLMFVQLLCAGAYSEQYMGLPEFRSTPRDACTCNSWYDPAQKQILDFGCGWLLPRDRAHRPPELEPSAEPPHPSPD